MNNNKRGSDRPYQSAASVGATAGIALVLLVTFFGTVQAENSPPERVFEKRFYLGVGAGVTDLDPEPMTSSLSVGDDRDTGYSLFVGYDLSKYFTIEGYYANLGDAGIRFLGDDVGTVSYDVYGVSGLGYLFNSRGADSYAAGYDDEGRFRREGLSAYLRFGIGGMSNASETVAYNRDHTAHLSAGLGLEYGWANGVAVRGEVSSYDTDAHIAGLSLLKRFGGVSGYQKPSPAALTNVTVEPVIEQVKPAIMTPTSSYFAFAKYDLSEETQTRLLEIAELMQADTSLKISLAGHTDWTGPEAFNQTLSVQRAQAVERFLLSHGIGRSRVSLEGFGETRPIASNTTREGRALNRRVDLELE